MFFKKKREAKIAAARDAKRKVRQDFEQELLAAEQCPDPAKRFLKLEELQQSVDAWLEAARVQIEKDARSKFDTTYLGITGGSAVGAIGLATTLHFPPAGLLIWPAIYAARQAGLSSMEREREKLAHESAPLFAALAATRDEAHEKADVILKNDLKKIAESPDFPVILARAPRIRDHFTAAFVKNITGEDRPEAAPRKKHDNGFKL